MTHTISKDRKTLTIKADSAERERIKLVLETGENEQGITCDMGDIFDPLVSNSELEWINPADTHDLTDAPMLGILDEAQPLANKESFAPHYGFTLAGNYGSPPQIHVHPILERWAFMDYQVRSPLEVLRDKGEAIFVWGAP